ncbi:MAG TPA: hypothetical protein VG891_00255 [Rhizomicrobium sp.]|nr:hypothetical protein [Rhizomicrobium sp.]
MSLWRSDNMTCATLEIVDPNQAHKARFSHDAGRHVKDSINALYLA